MRLNRLLQRLIAIVQERAFVYLAGPIAAARLT